MTSSIGIRRDHGAIAALEKLRQDPDTAAAGAAEGAAARLRLPL